MAEIFMHVVGNFYCQTGFADTTGTREGQQTAGWILDSLGEGA